jgi:hypothetical protein
MGIHFKGSAANIKTLSSNQHNVTYWIFLGNMAYAPRSVSIVT